MAKKKRESGRIVNKEENAEDWCFICKDGGELMICDHAKCLKAYHPECIEKDDSALTTDERWICGWHRCLICKGNSNFHCYCCDRAACYSCIGRIDFVHLKGKYGLCNNCLKLALLVEEDRNVDSDGESVDFKDRETYEGLFKEYYEIVKKKEGFHKDKLLAGKAQLDKEKISRISSGKDIRNEKEDERRSEDEAEQLSSGNEDFSDGESHKKRLKKERCIQTKTRMHRSVNSTKKEFVGWGSRALIDFLQLLGHDTSEKLSQYDVTSIVTNYIKEHKLRHPVKRRILCDAQLEAVFGKKVINRQSVFSLLESHFVENEEQLQKDELELDHDLEDDDDTEILVAPKTEKKVKQYYTSSIWYKTETPSHEFAAVIPQNIKHVYLKRSLVMEMIKLPESIETKIIGSFVRVKLDPRDHKQRNSHQLVQIAGIEHGSSDKCNSERLIVFPNMGRDVCLTMLSDCDFTEEECDDLREKVKAGLLKKLTFVEIEHKAEILHEDITKHSIAQELKLLRNLIDQANEKGWRNELFKHLERRKNIQQPWYLSHMLDKIPRVIPEEVETEPVAKDERDVNPMQQSSDETTMSPTKQNIPGVIPEEVDVEPLAKDERDDNKMHRADETTPTDENNNVVILPPPGAEMEMGGGEMKVSDQSGGSKRKSSSSSGRKSGSKRKSSSSSGRKRTMLNKYQKERVWAFVEKMGWKWSKKNEQVIPFCDEIGITPYFLKNWIDNRNRKKKGTKKKHLRKKDQFASN